MSSAEHVMAELAAELTARLPGAVQTNAPSAPLTTYRCGGPLAVLVRLDRASDLDAVAPALAARPTVPVLVIGRGSNLLISDAGFPGVGIVLGGDFERIDLDPDPESPTVTAASVVPLPVLARQSAKAGIAGLEFYVGIPGSVGGAVRMNVGGHGAQTRDVLTSVRVFDIDMNGQADLPAAASRSVPVGDLGLGYRRSGLGSRTVVLSARFAGHADDPDACTARIDEIVRWRREHQPGGQNAGSVFTNPPGDTAGRLIDAGGLKGLRVGGVVVSEKHANFFVAEPGAHADDVFALVQLVQSRVADATGIRLVPELQFVGFAGASEEVGE